MRAGRRVAGSTLLVVLPLAFAPGGCKQPSPGSGSSSPATAPGGSPSEVVPEPESPEARLVVERLQARFRRPAPPSRNGEPSAATVAVLPPGAAPRFDRVGGALRPVLDETRQRASARVTLPGRADGRFLLADARSGMSVEVSLDEALGAPAEVGAGYVVYRSALSGGGDLLHRASAAGTEDFLSFDRAPVADGVAELHWTLHLAAGVAGLRLAQGTLELVDGGGLPRLRVPPPYLVAADGRVHPATLSVRGCAVDTSAALPWRHAPTAPGADRCTVVISWASGAVTYPALLDPAWTSSASGLAVARVDHTAVVLTNGDVMFAGGATDLVGTATTSVELYHAGVFATAPAALTGVRTRHTATRLGDGRVLIAGGRDAGATFFSSSEVWTADASARTAGLAMAEARAEHSATLLADGRVLVVGGRRFPTITNGTIDIYDPLSASWTPGAVIAGPGNNTFDHAAVLLADGTNRVLIAGGMSCLGPCNLGFDRTLLYNPATDSWATGPTMNKPRSRPTITRLPTGRFLIVGDDDGGNFGPSSQLFEANATLRGDVGMFHLGTIFVHAAVLLADGRVLVSGGEGGGSGENAFSQTFVETGVAPFGAWTDGPLLNDGRGRHTASLLPTGEALIAGGYDFLLGTVLSSAELFTADYANGTACGANAVCATGLCVDGVCCNTACTNACDACNVVGNLGTCVTAPAGTACGLFACDGASQLCPASCTDDNGCAPAAYCAAAGTCLARKVQGQTCNPALDCLTPGCRVCSTSNCVDGVCCDTACGGACDACSVAAGASTDGTCGVVGAGNPGSPACAPYLCNGSLATCPTTCTANTECVPPNICDVANQCAAPAPSGQPCVVNSDCASGFCVGNVCCATACLIANGSPTCGSGTCQVGACNGGFADCNGVAEPDGCEASLASDPDHCGGCGTVCSGNHITTRACSCVPVHGAFAANAPGLAFPGPFTSPPTPATLTVTFGGGWDGGDVTVIGLDAGGAPLAEVFAALPGASLYGTLVFQSVTAASKQLVGGSAATVSICAGGVCTGACDLGFGDCNTNKLTDGCETATTVQGHCGGCGVTCTTSDVCKQAGCATVAGAGQCVETDKSACATAYCALGSACGTWADGDGDGFSDVWETNGYIDMNCDGAKNAGDFVFTPSFVDDNCNGAQDGGEPSIPAASTGVPDLFVKYDWMDLPSPGTACVTDANCTAVGPTHVDEKCVAGLCTGHTHDPNALAPCALPTMVRRFYDMGFHLHVIRGSARPHSHVVGFRQPEASCEGAAVAAGVIGQYAVNLFDLKDLAYSAGDPAALAHHYGVFGHYSACDIEAHCNACPVPLNPDGTPKGDPPRVGQTGYAEVDGNDFIVSLGHTINDNLEVPTVFNIGGTFMHELGHNLGLRHGGGANRPCSVDADCPLGVLCSTTGVGTYCLLGEDTPGYKPNHLSVMNYRFQTTGIENVDPMTSVTTTRLDYSREELPHYSSAVLAANPSLEQGVLDENGNLHEPAGLGSAFAGDKTSYTPGICGLGVPAFTSGAIDWDGDGDFSNTNAWADANWPDHQSIACGNTYVALRGHKEWGPALGQSVFNYGFQCTPYYLDGLGPLEGYAQSEATPEELAAAHVLLPPLDGVPDGVRIDVRPGCATNWIATGSPDEVEVVVFGSAELDVTQLDPSTLQLAAATAVSTMPDQVDGDGVLDLRARFVMASLHLSVSATVATLSGALFDSRAVYAPDAVTMVSAPGAVVTPHDDGSGYAATIRGGLDGRWQPYTLDRCVDALADRCGGPLTLAAADATILRITSDEGSEDDDHHRGFGRDDDHRGSDHDGDHGDPGGDHGGDHGAGNDEDMRIDGAQAFSVRRERDGSGDGRVYTVWFTVSDGPGSSTLAPCRIQVPHRPLGRPAVDSGPESCVGVGCP